MQHREARGRPRIKPGKEPAMLSQANSLQRTILAIVTIASLMGLASRSALATPITVTYEFKLIDLNGDFAGMVTGSFTGDPGNNCSTIMADCFLTVNEL